MAINELTIAEARKGLDEKKFSAVELTKACLDRIAKRNGTINAFITVCTKEALAEAAAADAIIAAGKATLLTGIPYCVKDAIVTKGVRSTAAAKILDSYVSPHDATVVARVRAAGAVLLGKTNCDAFGHGSSNENSMYGPVKNPHDITKVAGGSSGGAAAAVADYQAFFALAEDTGGSIRQPASLCGIVGFRPGYGTVSRYGAMALASSLDVVGPMTRTVADCATVMQIIAGRDPLDATSLDTPAERELPQSYRIGIPKEYFEVEGMDPEVKKVTEDKIAALEKAGCTIVPLSLPYSKYSVAVYYIIVPSEDSSNLSRMDGIRYGVRQNASTLYDVYAKSREQGLPEEVKRRIFIGTYALSAGFFDAYYTKAAKVRTLIKKDFDLAFTKVDAILAPTSPFPAFGVGEKTADPLAMYLADILVSPASIAGVPAISVPAGKTKTGLPIGVHVVTPPGREDMALAVSQHIESIQ